MYVKISKGAFKKCVELAEQLLPLCMVKPREGSVCRLPLDQPGI